MVIELLFIICESKQSYSKHNNLYYSCWNLEIRYLFSFVSIESDFKFWEQIEIAARTRITISLVSLHESMLKTVKQFVRQHNSSKVVQFFQIYREIKFIFQLIWKAFPLIQLNFFFCNCCMLNPHTSATHRLWRYLVRIEWHTNMNICIFVCEIAFPTSFSALWISMKHLKALTLNVMVLHS